MSTITRSLFSDISREMQVAGKQLAHSRYIYKELTKNAYLIPDLDSLISTNSSITTNVGLYSGLWINIYCPWDPTLCDKICLEFTKLGWELSSTLDYTDQFKEMDYYFTHPDFGKANVKVEMDASRKGSKCQLVVVGQEVVSRPKYKIICEDQLNV